MGFLSYNIQRTERERGLGVYLSKLLSGKRIADIGAVFGITNRAVTSAVRGNEERREEDRRFNLELMRIKEIVRGPRKWII